MKKTVNNVLCGVALLMSVMTVQVEAAELLDVKPIVSGTAVTVEIAADIPMTYTYYKIPGEARAVVDIADADPEKIEPLLVVNKGAVSSISVDKAMIATMTISRLVFNLVSETDITVVADADRKKLLVSFGAAAGIAPVSVTAPAAVPPAAEVPKPAPVSAAKDGESLELDEPQKPVAAASAKANPAASVKEEDPLGLDEPVTPTASAVPVAKLSPVVPAAIPPNASETTVVTGIVVGSTSVDITTKSAVASYKTLVLDEPSRLVIDVVGGRSAAGSSYPVKKFGIDKVRIAANGSNVRIVFDAKSGKLPQYRIIKTDNGLQVQFK